MKKVFRKPCVIINYIENIFKYFDFLGPPDKVISWVYNAHTPRKWRAICFYGVTPDFSKIKIPFKNIGDKRLKGKEGANIYDWWHIEQVKNVSEEKTSHPCQIPFKIMRNIIQLCTSCDDLIVDPFLGSGTTVIACLELKRNYIGIDISSEYCDIAIKRRDNYLNQLKLF